jgi:hypothetical protein
MARYRLYIYKMAISAIHISNIATSWWYTDSSENYEFVSLKPPTRLCDVISYGYTIFMSCMVILCNVMFLGIFPYIGLKNRPYIW